MLASLQHPEAWSNQTGLGPWGLNDGSCARGGIRVARAGRNHAAPAGLLGLVRPDAARGAGLGRAALLFTGEEREAPFIPGLNGTPLPAPDFPAPSTGRGLSARP